MNIDAPQQAFDAELELHGADGGVFLTVPFSVPEVFGTRGQLHVRGTIDGFPFRLPLVPNGEGEHIMVVRKEIRNAIDKTWGTIVHVVMAPDIEERSVLIPDDLAHALNKAGLNSAFDQLAYAHRKEYARWIERAKKAETRMKRLHEALELIKAGKKLS
ncbi:YdeI/OmpD-associated family protein [Hymenobacter crusticola]|uniref:Antitermination protein NusB n=1 Tax=Hymenobacter crusticola TaxID=1770526 RepID=A0A243WAS4_9BACT|nr:YdeI/OmpD-associated family protein [Hymenobacter crusticola]OUJ71949.1 hypothetical protein BXP70_20225 [Hymenobacter crusticola]